MSFKEIMYKKLCTASGTQWAFNNDSHLQWICSHAAPFYLLQKQLTQDDDADEVEIAIDNTAFMDEFFSEVGSLSGVFL